VAAAAMSAAVLWTMVLLVPAPASATGSTSRPSPGRINISALSSGARAWFSGPPSESARLPTPLGHADLGSNVNANNPQYDLAGGQSETAIAAFGSTVVSAWNDATSLFVTPSTDPRASRTGIGFSTDGGRTFTDLIGLRNDNPNQKWSGDPTIVAIDAEHFAIGSLYFPVDEPDCGAPASARFQLAVEIFTVNASGAAGLGPPVVAADGGDLCLLRNNDPSDDPPDLAMLDKEWLSYDPVTRSLAMSYTRDFFIGTTGGHSGNGQVELVQASVPNDPTTLSASSWSAPITVWPEEPNTVNAGAYVSLAPGGDAYVAWERNIVTNRTSGDPYVYIHAARVRPGDASPVVGGPASPRVVSLGQRNSSLSGGVKSLGSVPIAGYISDPRLSSSPGQDFPRIAVHAPLGLVLVVWNDASVHPLGDIWLRALPLDLSITGPISKANDDDSYALHFMPAVSVRSDGSTSISWYDRRIGGADSTVTDYFGEIRGTPSTPASDFRITTGSTNWAGTSSALYPNFGDYTDNASTGTTTYYSWADGRLGVPQPFVDHR
jgi:hypothetical protein